MASNARKTTTTPKPKATPKTQAEPKQTPEADPYAPKAWSADGDFDFVTPSGQRCLIRGMTIEQLVFDGIIEDLDAVSAIVNSELITPKTTGKKTTKKNSQAEGLAFMADPKNRKVFELMDQVIMGVVMKPTIHPNPKPGEKVESGKVYVRNIELRDRLAIFERVMTGVEKTADFREEPA